jgi:hypothetical protein
MRGAAPLRHQCTAIVQRKSPSRGFIHASDLDHHQKKFAFVCALQHY